MTETQKASYNEGLKVLQNRVLAYEYRELVDQLSPKSISTTPTTLYAAIDDFKKTQFPGFMKATKNRCFTAMRHFLLLGGDMRIEYNSLRGRRFARIGSGSRLSEENQLG